MLQRCSLFVLHRQGPPVTTSRVPGAKGISLPAEAATQEIRSCVMDILVNNVLPAVVPTFVIMFLGYMLGRKTKYDLKFATDATMYFTLPILIFSALAQKWDTPFLAREFLITGIGTLIIIAGIGIFVFAYLRWIRADSDMNILYPTIMF